MGEVYRARDPGLGRDLAVKVMRPNFRTSSEIEARFLREARITGALQHPAIVPVHNLGRLPDGRLYFTQRGEEMKCFHVRDGAGIVQLLRAGLQVAVISGRQSKAVERPMAELGRAGSPPVIQRPN